MKPPPVFLIGAFEFVAEGGYCRLNGRLGAEMGVTGGSSHLLNGLRRLSVAPIARLAAPEVSGVTVIHRAKHRQLPEAIGVLYRLVRQNARGFDHSSATKCPWFAR